VFVSSDRIPYKILRERWFHIILNVHAPTGDKIDGVKISFYKELGCVIDKLPKYLINIILVDFGANGGREDIFKPTIGNESFHEIINGIGVVNFAISKNLTVRSMMVPLATSINILGHL
jgi:hypothetical protein